MAYSNNIPQPTDRLKDSQPDILANFQAIGTFVAVNHIGFNTGANEGKHNYIQFPNVQAVDVPTGAGEVALYSKTGITGVPALFFRGESNSAVDTSGFTEALKAIIGWTRLPSGILLKWGLASTTLLGDNTVTFPVGPNIPVFSTIFVILATPSGLNSVGGTLFSRTNSTTNFIVSTSKTGMSTQYLAIGV